MNSTHKSKLRRSNKVAKLRSAIMIEGGSHSDEFSTSKSTRYVSLSTEYSTSFAAKNEEVPMSCLSTLVQQADLTPLDVLNRQHSLHGFELDKSSEDCCNLTPNRYPINKPVDNFIHTQDWAFLRSEQRPVSDLFGTSVPTHCPSLASGSTISSRNSSTRSTNSVRWLGSDRLSDNFERDLDTSKGSCPIPDCHMDFSNLKLHMLNHQKPPQNRCLEKCPVKTCQYHKKGFTRAFDRIRHTNTHFKGTLVCGFCPATSSVTDTKFSRLDVFSRHLARVHGVKQLSPGRFEKLYSAGTVKDPRKVSTDVSIATCTLCSEPFDAQGLYEHLRGCVDRQVTRDCDTVSNESGYAPDSDEAKESSPSDSVLAPDVRSIKDLSGQTGGILFAEKNAAHQTILAPEDSTSSLPDHTNLQLAVLNHKSVLVNKKDKDIEELTLSSRCLSLTSSNGLKTSDEETDWTEDDTSPESETEAVRFQPMLSPMKRQLLEEIMKEFHRLFDQQYSGTRTHYGGSSNGSSHDSVETFSTGSTNGDSPYMSRKRSLSGGGSRPPNGDRNNGDDPHKRRRPDSKSRCKDTSSELRFACPFYKRNPGRHQTFTSCRDPGFITVARLKEHLYRRHLLPIQCNRCCTTFANEPSLREHQRDPHGCEIQEQIPLEGFDKDQERKLKSKKRSLVHQSEEDKWKSVYRILFPDDNDADMPSPHIEYQHCNSNLPSQSSNIAHFQEFSRLELPRLVRRTLEIVVEQESQPLEEKLKERLVDIVKECQTQLITMFQGMRGPVNIPDVPNENPAPSVPEESIDSTAMNSFRSFDSLYSSAPGPCAANPPAVETKYVMTDPCGFDTTIDKKQSNDSNSGSPDSGYDSTWATVGLHQPAFFDAPLAGGNEFLGFPEFGFPEFEHQDNLDAGLDPSTWSF